MKNTLLTLCGVLITLSNLQSQGLSNIINEPFLFNKNHPTIHAPIDSSELRLIEKRANCFCVVSYDDLTNKPGRSGVCMDLTSRVGLSFTGLGQQSPKNQRKCDKRCSDVAGSLSTSELQAIANCACSRGKHTGVILRAFSSLGMRNYSSAHYLGKIVNMPAKYKTTCSCPNGWTVDNGQKATNRKCKKGICRVAVSVPNMELPNLPGFVWDNVIYQWTKGDCVTKLVSPAACKLVR